MKPIIFNTEMVQAILDNRKTVTRRVIPEKMVDEYYDYDDFCISVGTGDIPTTREYEQEFFGKRARYQVGDILYVRETWCKNGTEYLYKAGFPHLQNNMYVKWKPSIHMPKSAARIFLKVTGVRAERLQDITADQLRQEGLTSMSVHCGDMEIAAKEWELLWNPTIEKQGIDKYGWDANPWVWVIEFEKLKVIEKTCKTCNYYYKEHCCNSYSYSCTEAVSENDTCEEWERRSC